NDRAEACIRRGDLGVVAILVAIAETELRVHIVWLVWLEEGDPEKYVRRLRHPVEVGPHLPCPRRRPREPHFAVLEIEGAVAEGPETFAVDEEDGGRVEGRRAIAVAPEVERPGFRVVAEPLQKKRAHVLARHEGRDGVRGVWGRAISGLE